MRRTGRDIARDIIANATAYHEGKIAHAAFSRRAVALWNEAHANRVDDSVLAFVTALRSQV